MSYLLERMLNTLRPDVLDLVIKLRILVIGSNPNVVERIYPSWKTIGYGVNQKMSGQVCYIEAQEKSARLGFNRGVFLPDNKHLLDGSGELLRYIEIKNKGEIDTVAFLDLLKAAWEDASHTYQAAG